MYNENDYAPLITKHDISAEAKHLASVLKQDVWVVERILRNYWKDKLAVEWTTQDVKNCSPPNIKLSDQEAFEVLQNVSADYSSTWGITSDDIEHSIEIYMDYKEKENCCGHCK